MVVMEMVVEMMVENDDVDDGGDPHGDRRKCESLKALKCSETHCVFNEAASSFIGNWKQVKKDLIGPGVKVQIFFLGERERAHCALCTAH